jgi:hypothetical protein
MRPACVFDHDGTVPPGLTKDVLLQALEESGRSFERGELAYLPVTSKVEFPVRDRFAWEHHWQWRTRSCFPGHPSSALACSFAALSW